jgi:hypothetical protein
MSLSDLFARMKLSPQDAEVIFDRDEPVGRPTDLVMPRRRWFGRKKSERDQGDHAIPGEGRSKSIS